MEFQDLGFVVPEKCRSYTVRLKPSIVDRCDTLLAGASRSMLIESLLRRWLESIAARKRAAKGGVRTTIGHTDTRIDRTWQSNAAAIAEILKETPEETVKETPEETVKETPEETASK
jgi:hypothetical protein